MDRRAAVISAYNTEAPAYDEHEYPSETQREWVVRTLKRLPPGSSVLDAPCGTGKYFPTIAAAGHIVAGVDQSPGMLDQARNRGIAVSLERLSLQDLAYQHRFDAVLIIDAMENVSPEEWPVVARDLGEVTGGDTAGYHYYPGRDQVLAWFAAEGLEVLEEAYKQEDGWGYHHFLLCDRRKSFAPGQP